MNVQWSVWFKWLPGTCLLLCTYCRIVSSWAREIDNSMATKQRQRSSVHLFSYLNHTRTHTGTRALIRASTRSDSWKKSICYERRDNNRTPVCPLLFPRRAQVDSQYMSTSIWFTYRIANQHIPNYNWHCTGIRNSHRFCRSSSNRIKKNLFKEQLYWLQLLDMNIGSELWYSAAIEF